MKHVLIQRTTFQHGLPATPWEEPRVVIPRPPRTEFVCRVCGTELDADQKTIVKRAQSIARCSWTQTIWRHPIRTLWLLLTGSSQDYLGEEGNP